MRRAHSRPPAPPSSDPVPPAVPAPAIAGSWLLATLLALGLARLAGGARPDMWWWGLVPEEFLPAWCRAAALLPLVLLIPPLGRLALAPLERLGGLVRTPGRAALFGALIAAIPVALMPDRLWLIGDFVLRQGATENPWTREGSLYQAMPLDLLVHNVLPAAFSHGSMDRANLALRAIGAAEAAVFGALAGWSLAGFGLSGAALIAALAGVATSGVLVVFTGLGKAAGAMCAFAVAIPTLAERSRRQPRAMVPLGFALSAALFMHRAALVFVPLWIVACVAWVRAPHRERRRAVDEVLVGVALPALLLAFLAPRLFGLLVGFDLPRHAGFGAGSWLATTFGRLRLADLVNVLVVLAPFAAIAIPVAVTRARFIPPVPALGSALAIAFLLVVRPQQGIFRDWDAFAFPAAMLSLAAALVLGGVLESAARWRWLAPALVATALVPTLFWLGLAFDSDRGAARVRHALETAPQRSDAERTSLWDFLATYHHRHGHWRESLEAMRRAVEISPSPRMVLQWAFAATRAGDLSSAYEAFRLLTQRDPGDPVGWVGRLGAAERLGDTAEARGLRELLEQHPPSGEAAKRVQQFLRQYPEIAPSTGTP